MHRLRGPWHAFRSCLGSLARGPARNRVMAAAVAAGLTAALYVRQTQAEQRVDVVLGAQWGDEGKGKLVDILGADYDLCARVAGGSNAGHTIIVGGRKFKFHLVPSAILNPQSQCIIGHGVVVHLRGLLEELRLLRAAGVSYEGRLFLSDRAHIVFDFHQEVDGINEQRLEGNKLGTTRKGIGPAYGSKVQRNGLRVGDLQDMAYFESRLRSLVKQLQIAYPGLQVDVESELEYYRQVREEVLAMTTDTISLVHSALKADKRVLVEGANATMIDIDFGTYPFVTSSNPSVGSTCTGLGVPPKFVGDVIGIVKAYCTRVGEGPFPTELDDATGETLRRKGGEFGTTTGRPRRCGWLDIPQVRYAAQVNGFDEVNLTKLDVLTGFEELRLGVEYVHGNRCLESMPASLKTYSEVEVLYASMPGWTEDISKCRRFEDLPLNAQNYVRRIEELTGLHVRWIGVGAGREDIIDRGKRVG